MGYEVFFKKDRLTVEVIENLSHDRNSKDEVEAIVFVKNFIANFIWDSEKAEFVSTKKAIKFLSQLPINEFTFLAKELGRQMDHKLMMDTFANLFLKSK